METIRAFSLPPGFGFHPTDVELVSHYLKRKILGHKNECEVIPEVDIYKHEPWDLPAKSHIPTRDCKWHFFTSRGRKYPNGSRSNRATKSGYWKSTGKDRNVRHQNRVIGTKKTLVFHEGRPPSGKRTDWIMHEYYLNENEFKQASGVKDIFVLCRVTKRDVLTKEDDEMLSTQIENGNNSCIPLSHENPEQLQKVFAPVVQKVEPPSPSGNTDDLEAWFRELYDPNFDSATVGELERDFQVDTSSLPLKHKSTEPYFLLNLVEDTRASLLGGNNLCDILGDQAVGHSFDYDLFENYTYGTADPIGAHQLNAGAMDSLSSPVFEAGGCIENAASIKNSQAFEGLLDHCRNKNPIDKEECDTGIEIRERHGRPSIEIPTSRILLQVHKMESRNPGPINQTFTFISEDSHLDSDGDLNPGSVSSNTEHGASNRAKIQIEENFASGKSSSAPILRQAVEKYEENISERSETEALASKVASEYSSPESSLHLRRTAVHGRIGPVLRRCSSVGLSCLFLVTCMIGTAALIVFFLLRDARRLLSGFPLLSL